MAARRERIYWARTVDLRLCPWGHEEYGREVNTEENRHGIASVEIPTLICGHEVGTTLEEHKATAKVVEMSYWTGTCGVPWTDRQTSQCKDLRALEGRGGCVTMFCVYYFSYYFFNISASDLLVTSILEMTEWTFEVFGASRVSQYKGIIVL